MDSQQQEEPEVPVPEMAAFVMIRYPISLHQSCKNSLIKWLSVHRNYTGVVAGVSNRIDVLEGDWPKNKGIALLQFDNVKEALKWVHCTPEIKQPDWLDMVDMAIIPCVHIPPITKRFIQVLDIEFRDYQSFLEDYVKEVTPFLRSSGADGGVVATDKIKKTRGLWDPRFLVLNFWGSEEDFTRSYRSDAYQPLKEKRMCYADTTACLFELDPLFD